MLLPEKVEFVESVSTEKNSNHLVDLMVAMVAVAEISS